MKLGLCVVGCGSFAKTFASSIQPLLPQINLYFASRDLAKAQAYSQMFHGAGAFGCSRVDYMMTLLASSTITS